jgi:hypothetical protein
MPERGSSIALHRRRRAHSFHLFFPSDFFAPQAAWDGMCQPWFYLRLKAYGFVGLSEEA